MALRGDQVNNDRRYDEAAKLRILRGTFARHAYRQSGIDENGRPKFGPAKEWVVTIAHQQLALKDGEPVSPDVVLKDQSVIIQPTAEEEAELGRIMYGMLKRHLSAKGVAVADEQ